jgi:6-phosphogluconolactonase (cycloisomerase 2 family)
MKKFLAVSTLMSLIVCNLPELQSPTETTFISLLLRSLIRPPIEVSIIYNGAEYKPGSTIELGSSQAFVKKTSDIILRVTGTENISIDKTNGYSIETTSIGTIDLQASSNFPDVLPVGSEQNVSVITLPDSNLTNEWKFNLNITSPSVTTLSYTFKLLSTDVKPGALVLTGTSSTNGAESFVSAYTFSSTSGALSTENQIVFGSANASYRVVRSQDNNYIFFNDYNTSTFRSFRVGSTGSFSEVGGSPFNVGFSTLKELWQIPNQDRFFAYRASNTSYYTFPYDSNGTVSTSTGPFGGLCGAYTIVSPTGDYIYTTTPYNTSADIYPFELNSSGNMTAVATQVELDASNKLIIHLKSKLKPHLFTATHSSTVGTLKIDKVLRRTTNSDGTLGQVDTYIDLPNTGEKYTLFVGHPNDRFYYLGGITNAGTQVRVKGLNHNINSGDITNIFTLDMVGTNLVNMKVSPDGRHLAIIAYDSGCGSPCSNLYIYKIASDGNLSLTNTLNRASYFTDIEWGGY